MGGMYLHIPFCKQACRYCDFFFSVSLHYVEAYVDSLVKEIQLKGKSTKKRPLSSLYMGGGTPSLLSRPQLKKILKAVSDHYDFENGSEWTIECNPDDLSPSFAGELRELGFNRISMGIQSFQEKDLVLMRRSHNASQAEQSIQDAAEAGFDNITLDLIYGIPGQVLEEWDANIQKALSLPVTHISAYHLTFEPGTVFDHWQKKGRLLPVLEDESIAQFALLRKKLGHAGFDHYEISNFALSGRMSQHNLLYWSGQAYLGFGPSAHAYDGRLRTWNVSSLNKYMDGINAGESYSESEELSNLERYHDYLITSLRTRWGASPESIKEQFGEELHAHFESAARPFLKKGTLWINEDRVAIRPEHWLITDHLLRELF